MSRYSKLKRASNTGVSLLVLRKNFEEFLGKIFRNSFLGAVHMKIVFPLFSRLTGKKIVFPRVHIQNNSPPG